MNELLQSETGLSYGNVFNKDDVFLRNYIIAIRSFLNDKLYLENWFSGKKQKVSIPFFFNMGGNERFLQETFLSDTYDDTVEEKISETNVDVIPRGIFTISSIDVLSAELTNRFILGKRQVINNGQREEVISNLNVIPLTIPIDIQIKTNTKIDIFKLWQRIVYTFYKIANINFIYKGNPISAYLGFPESNNMENKYEFSFGDIQEQLLNFSIETTTYLPVYDEEFFNFNSDNTIQKTILNINDMAINESNLKQNKYNQITKDKKLNKDEAHSSQNDSLSNIVNIKKI